MAITLVTTRITDLKEEEAYKLLNDFLFVENLYTYVNPIEKKPIDLHYIMYNVSDKMYSANSSGCPSDVVASNSKSFKFIKAIKTYEMKKQFLKRLSYTGIHEIKIPRSKIKQVIDNCLPEEMEAVIKSFLFPDTKLKRFGEHLEKYEKKIKRFGRMDKLRLRKKAVEQIVKNLVMEEVGI